jgi:hypothetical protein
MNFVRCGNHFVLKLFTGFEIAVLYVRTQSIIKAIENMINPPDIKTHQLKFVLYAKFSSHLLVPYQAIGIGMMNAIIMSFKKSFDNNETI